MNQQLLECGYFIWVAFCVMRFVHIFFLLLLPPNCWIPVLCINWANTHTQFRAYYFVFASRSQFIAMQTVGSEQKYMCNFSAWSGCEKRTRKKKRIGKKNQRWNEHLKMNFYAYVPGLRLPMCISETIIFTERICLHFQYEHEHRSQRSIGLRPLFYRLRFFPLNFKFWWNWSFYIFHVAGIEYWHLIRNYFYYYSSSRQAREKKPKKFSVLSFINQHGLIHLDRISWKPNDIVRANKINLYFIQKTIWP